MVEQAPTYVNCASAFNQNNVQHDYMNSDRSSFELEITHRADILRRSARIAADSQEMVGTGWPFSTHGNIGRELRHVCVPCLGRKDKPHMNIGTIGHVDLLPSQPATRGAEWELWGRACTGARRGQAVSPDRELTVRATHCFLQARQPRACRDVVWMPPRPRQDHGKTTLTAAITKVQADQGMGSFKGYDQIDRAAPRSPFPTVPRRGTCKVGVTKDIAFEWQKIRLSRFQATWADAFLMRTFSCFSPVAMQGPHLLSAVAVHCALPFRSCAQ